MGCPDGAGKAYGVFEIIGGACLAIGGIGWLLLWFDFADQLNVLVLAIWQIALGVFIVFQVFKGKPGFMGDNFNFWDKLWGRGGLFIFVGALNLNFTAGTDFLIQLGGFVNTGLGIAYVVAHFVPAMCKPEPLCGGGEVAS